MQVISEKIQANDKLVLSDLKAGIAHRFLDFKGVGGQQNVVSREVTGLFGSIWKVIECLTM